MSTQQRIVRSQTKAIPTPRRTRAFDFLDEGPGGGDGSDEDPPLQVAQSVPANYLSTLRCPPAPRLSFIREPPRKEVPDWEPLPPSSFQETSVLSQSTEKKDPLVRSLSSRGGGMYPSSVPTTFLARLNTGKNRQFKRANEKDTGSRYRKLSPVPPSPNIASSEIDNKHQMRAIDLLDGSTGLETSDWTDTSSIQQASMRSSENDNKMMQNSTMGQPSIIVDDGEEDDHLDEDNDDMLEFDMDE